MPQIISITVDLTVPDGVTVQDLRDRLEAGSSWSKEVSNPDFNPEQPVDPVSNPETIDNPETAQAFAKRYMANALRNALKAGKKRLAEQADSSDEISVD